MPLRLEVAGAKIDATFLQDYAYEAGRDLGVATGYEIAERQARETSESDGRLDDSEARILDELTIRAPAQGLPFTSLAPRPRATRGGSHYYDANAACAAAGINTRQMEYWVRTGLVQPEASDDQGSELFSFKDILIMRIVKRLLDTGVSLAQIRTVVGVVRERSLHDLSTFTLMSDGVSVYEATGAEEVIGLVASGQGVFGVAVGRLIQELEKTLGHYGA